MDQGRAPVLSARARVRVTRGRGVKKAKSDPLESSRLMEVVAAVVAGQTLVFVIAFGSTLAVGWRAVVVAGLVLILISAFIASVLARGGDGSLLDFSPADAFAAALLVGIFLYVGWALGVAAATWGAILGRSTRLTDGEDAAAGTPRRTVDSVPDNGRGSLPGQREGRSPGPPIRVRYWTFRLSQPSSRGPSNREGGSRDRE